MDYDRLNRLLDRLILSTRCRVVSIILLVISIMNLLGIEPAKIITTTQLILTPLCLYYLYKIFQYEDGDWWTMMHYILLKMTVMTLTILYGVLIGLYLYGVSTDIIFKIMLVVIPIMILGIECFRDYTLDDEE